jgi:hypothetical protein
MKTSFTPGPWHWKNEPNGSANLFAEDGARVILFDARLINQEANARLIAAAPQLLNALKELHAHHRGFSSTEEWTIQDDEARELAEEAINLATR